MKDFSIKDAFKFGWEKTRDNFKLVFGVMVCYVFLLSGNIILGGATHKNPDLSTIVAFTFLALKFISVLLSIGAIKFALNVMDEKPIVFRSILSQTHYFWRFVGVRIMTKIILIVGLIFLIIPGIIWGLMFSFAPIIVIDRDSDVIDSLGLSQKITNGVKLKLFGFFILIGLLNILGTMAILIGLVVTIPASLFATLYVYRSLWMQTFPTENVTTLNA